MSAVVVWDLFLILKERRVSIFNKFGLSAPIIQAPMAGGITTPALVASVANAGAIGSFGFAYSSAEKIAADMAAAREMTQGVINANFFVFSEMASPSSEEEEAAISCLQEMVAAFAPDTQFSPPKPPFFPDLAEQMAPLWALSPQAQPQILTFHFAPPPHAIIEQAKARGILIGVTATSVSEAQAVEACGADFIVAQGREAGGHRGTFSPLGVGDDWLEAETLVTALKAETELPIVSAGGIMTGADIRRRCDLGAEAVQLGTAFLCCPESGANDVYRSFLLNNQDRKTVYTLGFSGRWAQGIENTFTKAMVDRPVLPFPLQNTLTGPLRKAATAASNGEYQSFWAGEEFAKARALPASTLIATLISEMETAS